MSAPITLERKLARTADEWDAFDKKSKALIIGSRKKIKVSAHRRDRRQARVAIVKGQFD